jgi:glycosyltransferase involved in cell wall biosynthesis
VSKVDVIIPAYLPEQRYVSLLQRALKSLESQTFRDFKTIVVLNGCFQDGHKIAGSLSFNNEIEILEIGEKASGAIARNVGISASKANLIAQLDADDQYHPLKLQKQFDFFKNNNVDFLGTLAFDYHSEDDIRDSCFQPGQFESHEQILEGLNYQNVMCHSSVMCKRESILKLGSYNELNKPGTTWPEYDTIMWEDWDLWIRACKSGMIMHNLPERLYYWSTNTSVAR